MAKKKTNTLLRTLSEYFIFFIICSFIGWVYEVFWELVVWGNGFINRGTMYGPWIPVYGFGGILISLCFYRFVKDKDIKTKLLRLIPLFIGVFILTSVVELITSYICDLVMGYYPWDYTMFKYTIDNRVALNTSLIFGVGGIAFLYILKPLTDKILSKLSNKKVNAIALILLIIFILDFLIAHITNRNELPKVDENINYFTVLTNNMEEYEDINLDDYEFKIIESIDEYIKLFPNTPAKLDFERFEYVTFSTVDSCGDKFLGIKSYKVKNNTLILEMVIDPNCGVCAAQININLIELPKNTISKNGKVEVVNLYDGEKHCAPDVAYKPMIYIYPDKEMDIEVKLSNPNLLTTTYPKYNDSWNIHALVDGTIKYNNRGYYGLYWEGRRLNKSYIHDEGFVVSKDNLISFLEEKLNILGLTDKESNEFIIYWLPILEKNKYNYIYFETIDEINDNMELIINPKPNTLIRVMMLYKGLDEPIDIRPQVLDTKNRHGYTIVEWGGSEISS